VKALTFIRIPFLVVGYQLTANDDDLNFIADWCDGMIFGDNEHNTYIRVPVNNPTGNRRRYEARVGDYILRIGSSFKVYTKEWLDKTFLEVPEFEEPEETMRNKPKRNPGEVTQPILPVQPNASPRQVSFIAQQLDD
jgi:hypothetical protein